MAAPTLLECTKTGAFERFAGCDGILILLWVGETGRLEIFEKLESGERMAGQHLSGISPHQKTCCHYAKTNRVMSLLGNPPRYPNFCAYESSLGIIKSGGKS